MWSKWRGQVRPSKELDRVLRLPRRWEPPEGWEQISALLAKPGSGGVLRPVQAQALAELHTQRGLFAPIRVGGGKTLVTFLAPHMVASERPLLLIPAKLRDKTIRDFRRLAEEWREPPPIKILSYEMLARADHKDDLEDYGPDLIMADEAHRLKNPKSACPKRIDRYLQAHPDTVCVVLSGTMTKRSLYDFIILGEWTLGRGFPGPLEKYDLECWSRALDEDGQWFGERLHPGALLEAFGDDGEGSPEDRARRGFRRRLVETPGVVATDEQPVDASLVLSEWSFCSTNAEQKAALALLRDEWQLPDGTELMDAVEVWRHALELAQGFWYRWSEEPPAEWLAARKGWAAYCRHMLSRSRIVDTAGQLAKERPDEPVLRRWLAVRDSYRPVTEPVWITRDVVDAAVAWVRVEEGLCWVAHRVMGEALEEEGAHYFGSLGKNRDGLYIEDSQTGGAVSIAANCEGRNLQHYSKNLVLCPPTTGDRWEQLLGRTHRDGQKADEVSVEVYLGCQQARTGLAQAISDARYQKSLLGEQKLRIADITVKGVRT